MPRTFLVCLIATACGGRAHSFGDDDGPLTDADGDLDSDSDSDSDGDVDTDTGVVRECSDVDADGYGVGDGCHGPDCDDSNPEVWSAPQCEALCEADAHSTGCPCDDRAFPEPEICYSGPIGTLGIGECRGGLRICDVDHWGACQGQSLPDPEACNERDDDCDGLIDEYPADC